MNNFNEDYLINEFFEKKQRGMSFSEIRLQLEGRKIPEENIKSIIWSIDDKVINKMVENHKAHNAQWLIFSGALFMFVGLFVTIGTLFNLIGIDGYYIIAYGPFFSGSAMLFYGLRLYKKKNR